ncbi:MAG: DNA repair protein RadA [Chlamydiae bacterium]|nr:DNA repair protein RadA [Chlamydiota bacterium]
MAKTKTLWSCNECGHIQSKWTGSCSTCQKWNTFVEEVEISDKGKRFEAASEKAALPIRISDVKDIEFKRLKTGFGEFDRLMGGGIVAGSLTLVGGSPGIGKSTLMMQVSHKLAMQGLTVLYICGEESVEQTSLRAKRLDISSDQLYLLSETNFTHIKHHIDQLQPDVLIVDSIQILYKQELPSAPGSVTQVRELATEFMHISKGMGISTFLIGHVTKSGEIAGPRVLEHIVDTVLDFDGDQQHGYRMLRGIKNRFGPTDDIAIFQMSGEGLTEVSNPSLIFLEERAKKTPGSAIIPTIEGSRAFLVEIQALVAPSPFSNSTRKSTGLNPNRLTLLLAVLEKRMGFQLHNKDVFVSVAGGLKITEPAIDLGVILAISSSFSNRTLDPKIAVLGEIGLAGEVRSIPRIESRIKEAINMGFTACILPKRNLKGLSKKLTEKIQLHGIEYVEQAINYLQKE